MGRGDLKGPMPAQFALRVAVLGGVGLAMFAIVFFRLWYLQVLSGDHYKAEAQNNQVREFTVQAPRGRDHSTATARCWSTTARRSNCRSSRPTSRRLEGAPREGVPPPPAGRRPTPGADPPQDPRRGQGVRRVRRDPAPRRPLRHRLLPAREPGPLPGCLGAARVRAPVSPGHRGSARARLRRRGHQRRPQGPALSEPRAGRQGRQGGGRVHLRQPACAASTGRPGSRSTHSGAADRRPALRPATRRAATTSVLTLDDHVQRAGQDAISAQGLPGGFVGDERPQRGAARARPEPLLSIPAVFAKPLVPQSVYKAL